MLPDEKPFKHPYLHCLSYGFDVKRTKYSDHSDTNLPAHDHLLYTRAHANESNSGIIYLSTIHTGQSKHLLEKTVTALLTASAPEDGPLPQCLYQVYYEQQHSDGNTLAAEGRILDLPPPSVMLTFDDATLGPVQEAWRRIMGEAAEGDDVQYMVFTDREGVGDEDDFE